MNVQTQLRILAAVDASGGVLTPRIAEPLGIDRKLLTRARDLGILDRPLRGVYVRPGLEVATLMATAARIGPPALLSHRGAANDYGLDGVERGVLEWSIPHTRKKPLPNVYLRRRFDDLEVVERGGVRVTSVAQTLADLGSILDADRVERAMESALRMDLIGEIALRQFADPASGRPGAPTLRAVLLRRPLGARPTESDAETLCLQAYRKGGVPEPTRQFDVYDGDIFVGRVDFHWWPIWFGAEVDGLGSHATHDALQYDLTRANNIGDAGHLIRRFTYWDITKRPLYLCRKTLRGLEMAKSLYTNGRRDRPNGATRA
jgi:hypothetical protein